jgi:hypothetical protein
MGAKYIANWSKNIFRQGGRWFLQERYPIPIPNQYPVKGMLIQIRGRIIVI